MRLPKSFPDGTKYVVEGGGAMIRRYVVLPNGRKINLSSRKSVPCRCRDQRISIVPDHAASDAPLLHRRIFA
jgi:hypothetical protein